QDRIDELASASIPFDFRVHSIIYSSDCFGMESTIHNKLSNNRVNKVNMHKEFFYSTPVEMEHLILDTDPTAEFVEYPKCEEYDISISSSDSITNANHIVSDN
ncbi:MAG: GIY-YIG nuclease family protein, partial [Bacilli bacterium]